MTKTQQMRIRGELPQLDQRTSMKTYNIILNGDKLDVLSLRLGTNARMFTPTQHGRGNPT